MKTEDTYCRTALELMRDHGDGAADYAMEQALRREMAGDDGGLRRWAEVWNLITEFQRTDLEQGELIH